MSELPDAAPIADAAEGRGRSLWLDAWSRLRENRIAMVSLWTIVAFMVVALYGEGVFWYYRDYTDKTPPYMRANLDEQYMPPSFARGPFAAANCGGPGTPIRQRIARGFGNLAHHPFGTDNLGRDVMSRTIQGARIAFQVGIITSLVAIPIGIFLGCIAGYFGGRLDDFVVWLYSTVGSIPSVLFILAVAMIVGKGLTGVYLGIGLMTWVSLCRLMRGETMKHKERPYVQAAQALGLGPWRIIFRHILPNILHVAIITFSLRFPEAIGTEVFLTFIGIGVQNEPSWGIMISNARLRMWQGVWWEIAFATAAIFIVVLSFNLFGDALRDALDPRLRKTEE